MHCKYCGQILKKSDKECPNCKHIIENNDINYTKKGHKLVLVFIILLLLGIIVGGYFYVNSPKTIFNVLINKVYKATNNKIKNYEQMKVNLGFSIDIDAGEEYKEVTDLLKDFKINSSANYDLTNKKMLMGLSAEYKNKLLAEMDMYYENNIVYVDLKDLFSKLIKVEIEEMEEIEITENDINIIYNNIFNAFKEAMKVSEYTSSEVKLDNIDFNKSVMVINNDNKDILINTYIDYLLASNEFITAVSKVSNVTYQEIIEILKESKDTSDLEEEIHFSVYTKMFTNEFVKFEVSIDGKVMLSFYQENDNNYKIEIFNDDGTKSEIVITNDNLKFNVSFDMSFEGVKAKVNVDISYVFNEKIQMPLTKESVFVDEIEEEEFNQVYEKLMEDEAIIEIIDRVSSMFTTEESEIEDEELDFEISITE